MPAHGSLLNKFYHTLLISLFTLSVFPVLFIFRSVDDNRLTSWQWTFAHVDVSWIFLALILGIIFAYLLSRVSFPEHAPILFLFLSSFVVSIIFWKEPEVLVDASRYFTQAKHLKVYGIKYFITEWGRDIHAWTDLPLVPFLYGLIFKSLGESRMYIQILTTFFFSMTCVLTYLIGKTLWDRDTGFFGGMLLLGIPYLLTQVPLMLVDIPTMFFLTLSIFTFIKAMERGRSCIAFSSCAVFLAFFSKYSNWLMLSVLAIVFLVYLKNPRTQQRWQRTVLQRSIVVAYISVLLISALIVLKFDVFSGQITFLHEYQMPGLKRWGESFVSTFFYQIHPFITIAALCSIFIALKRRDMRYVIISWLIFIIVLLQIRRARYIMITFPMFALMASYGLQIIKTLELRKFVAYCSVSFSLVISIFVYLPYLQTLSSENLKDAGTFLNSIEEESIEVITIPSGDTFVNPAIAVPILDLYTEKEVHYQYDLVFKPSFEEIKESSLRFTWEYRNPEYYAVRDNDLKDKKAVVVISNGPLKALPEHIEQKVKGYKNVKAFENSTGLFRYSPFVQVYQP